MLRDPRRGRRHNRGEININARGSSGAVSNFIILNAKSFYIIGLFGGLMEATSRALPSIV